MGTASFQPKAICTDLIQAMRDGPYATAEHLPPETELSQALGISRTQLRDILAVLEQEGYITRRHGVGTIINRHVVNVPVRMDIETEFLDMIRQSGYEPGLAFAHIREFPAGEEIARHLALTPDTPVLCIDRLCTADGRPAIYCEDIVARSLVKREYTSEDLRQPIFRFLSDFCALSPYMDLTDLKPVAADERLAELFQIPLGSPLLCMREVDYDISGVPVFFSLQYFADGFFQHTVLRKKL